MYLSKNLLLVTVIGITGVTSLTGCGKTADTPKSDASKADAKVTDKSVGSATAMTASSTSNTATADGAGQKVTIGTESNFKPFSYKDPQGNPMGFEIDLAKAMCAEAKLDCKVVSQDFDGLIPALQAKKIDAIMAGMSDTPEREKVVAFSDSYFQNALVVVAKKASTINPTDLSGKTIGAQRGTVSAEYLASHFPKATAKLYDNQENANMDLASGRVEAMLADKAPMLAWLKSPKGEGFEVKGSPIDINDKIAIAFRQNDPLKDKFNTALTTLKGNGTYEKISKQYFADIK